MYNHQINNVDSKTDLRHIRTKTHNKTQWRNLPVREAANTNSIRRTSAEQHREYYL